MNKITTLSQKLRSIEEAIELTELHDQAYTRHYTQLLRQRRSLKIAIRILSFFQKKKAPHPRSRQGSDEGDERMKDCAFMSIIAPSSTFVKGETQKNDGLF